MSAPQYRCGDFLIDLGNRRFLHHGREVALEPRVFAVIAQLLQRSNELVTRNELLDAVWGHRYVTPSTLNRLIALARRAFGDDVSEPRYIQTVHGAGYRYVGSIARIDAGTLNVRARFEPPLHRAGQHPRAGDRRSRRQLLHRHVYDRRLHGDGDQGTRVR